MEKRELTAADVWAMFAETDRMQKEIAKLQEETALQMKETDRKFAETDRKFAENSKLFEESRQLFDKWGAKVKDVDSRVNGISSSNGRFAEEYFYNSLERKMEFAGIHFDLISNKFGYMKKMPDGTKLQDQFDIVMTNDKTVALIEVKYKADTDDLDEMVNRKVKNFRALFSELKDLDIYMGIGSLSFNDYVIEKAKKYGIGLLKQVGESIEYQTDWVRAY